MCLHLCLFCSRFRLAPSHFLPLPDSHIGFFVGGISVVVVFIGGKNLFIEVGSRYGCLQRFSSIGNAMCTLCCLCVCLLMHLCFFYIYILRYRRPRTLNVKLRITNRLFCCCRWCSLSAYAVAISGISSLFHSGVFDLSSAGVCLYFFSSFVFEIY